MHLLEEVLHFSHGFNELFFCMFGSLQGIISHSNSSITVQPSTVSAIIIATINTTTRAHRTWDIIWSSTYLRKLT